VANANLILLGQTIRMFRERAQPKKISQFRLASLMQWEGTAPIVAIEKGKRRPRPETLNALGGVLQLSPADIAYLHGLAGYRPVTVMPPIEQIKRVLQVVESDLAQHRYPVYVMDYQFRFWMMNTAMAASHGGALDHMISIMKQGIDGFGMVFDSRLSQDEDMNEVIERETLFRFKAYNLYRRHEPFYLAYPDCMQARLLPDDYQRFVQRWNEVDVQMHDIYPIAPQISSRVGSIILIFDIHMVEILHLDRLLFVAYYEPKQDDTGNRERCEVYFTQNSPEQKACIRAWDFHENGLI
jgi:hypothetical protein